MKKRTWKNKLTTTELRHLAEDADVTTLAELKRTLEEHAKWRVEGGIEPCWTCRRIGEKLGLVFEVIT